MATKSTKTTPKPKVKAKTEAAKPAVRRPAKPQPATQPNKLSESLKAAKDAIAADPINAKAKAAELKGMIEKWETSLKELVAPPAKAPVKADAKKVKS